MSARDGWRAALICLLLGPATGALAGERLVPMDVVQREHLDLQTVLPTPVSGMPLARAPGRVVLPPAREFAVTSLQPGLITHVNVALGVSVRRGQVLADIDSVALIDLQRGLVDAHSVFRVAEARRRRDETLWREGVISRLRWQETHSDYERAQAALRAAEQTLIASGVTPAGLKALENGSPISGRYQVLAPVDGVILQRTAVVGQRVDAMAPLFRVGKLDELWLEVDMPQEKLKEAEIGDPIDLEAPRALARIIEIGQSVDPVSQTALVRARVEQGAERLRPGMQLNVQLRHRRRDRLFSVPVAAVFSHEGRQYVFAERPGGYEAVEVAVAGQEAYRVVLHEGLRGDERLVTQGVAGLKAAWLGAAAGAEH